MKKLISLTFGLLLLGLAPAAEAALPVYDSASIKQAIMEFQQLKKQYDMLKKQYDEMVAMKDSMTGNYGMGILLNGIEEEASRRALPQTWREVVEMQKKGFYGDLLQHYSDMLPKIDLNFLSANKKDRDVVGYKLSKDNTQSAFAATEAVYNQLDQRLKTIEGLMGQIDQTQNIKQAMDLNSRIVAETGFVSLDLARLNSMQLSLQAVFQNDSNRELENHSEFFSQPK
jgi:type IV secretion system protein VirB5